MQPPQVVELVDVVGARLCIRAPLQLKYDGEDVDARESSAVEFDYSDDLRVS